MAYKFRYKKICVDCGEEFVPIGGGSQRCGSYKNKDGCSWKNYLKLTDQSLKRYRKTERYRLMHNQWARDYRKEEREFKTN